MELVQQAEAAVAPPDLTAKQSLRSVKSAIMTALMNGSVVAIAAPLVAVVCGVPSIVMGLVIYLVWTRLFGYSAFGCALALACLMLPVVIGATEQMLRLVPNHLREASYALGASKSRTITTVVLPAALPGIVSGSLLAVARAAGEPAPLLFAVGAASDK